MATRPADGDELISPPGFRGGWRDDDDARAVYSEAAGIGRIIPRAVAVPRDADDVVTLVRWAGETGTPLIARGSGSGMASGAIGDGVIVDLSRLRALGQVDAPARSVSAEPGVLRDVVDRAARRHRLRFPVDPSSGPFCTVGGMVATNAAGAHTLRAGSVRRWVRAIDCVFADGTRAMIRRGEWLPAGVPAISRFQQTSALASGGRAFAPRHVRKSSSGYAASNDLIDVLVGSEGTLAIFVGVELGLEAVPGGTASLLAAFPTLDEAAAGANSAREAGAAACELLDRTFVEIAKEGGAAAAAGIPANTEAVLLIEMEAVTPDDASEAARALARQLDAGGASVTSIALSEDDEHHLWSLRHAASPILSRLDPALKSMQFIEDGAVPPEHLPEYIRGVRAALDGVSVRGVIFGHAGDAHIHVNPLIDVRIPGWQDRVQRLFTEVCELTTRLGGTMSGEHGDGRLRAPVLGTVLGESAAAWVSAVKDAFDPRRILNPGVKEPLVGQRPIEDVKYDPSLPALPGRARAALDVVAERRAYAEFRLALLDDRGGLPQPSVAVADPAD